MNLEVFLMINFTQKPDCLRGTLTDANPDIYFAFPQNGPQGNLQNSPTLNSSGYQRKSYFWGQEPETGCFNWMIPKS